METKIAEVYKMILWNVHISVLFISKKKYNAFQIPLNKFLCQKKHHPFGGVFL